MAAQHDSSSSPRAWYYLGLGSVLAATLVHGYLTNHHFELKFGASIGPSICDMNETFSCSAAAASRFSEFLGVPIALWGALANLALFVLALLFPLTGDDRRAVARKNILLFSGFIALVSVVMGIVSLTSLTQYCPFCILTYVLSFLAFAGFYKGLHVPASGSASSRSLYRPADATSLAVSAGVILLAGFIAAGGIRRGYVKDDREHEGMIRGIMEEWQANPVATIEPVSPLTKGSTDPNAKMTIVEFADFRCGHCAHAAPVLAAFIRSHPDVRLVFQPWPLDGECNTSITHSNGASCALARAVVCAEKKQKGWPAHDWIFANQAEFGSMEAIDKKLPEMSQKLGLNHDELKTCMSSDEAKKAVEGSAAVGTRLNIKGTPSIFVNGRQLPGGQSLPVLQRAYEMIHGS